MDISEKSIEKYLVKRSRELKWLCYKFSSPANAGVCDRILITTSGDDYFIELKTKRGKLSVLQEKFIKDMEEHGRSVFVFSSKEEIDDFIRVVMIKEGFNEG